jgi:stage V sporulation protein SpoVS
MGHEEEVIKVGQNTKVSTLADRLVKRVFEQDVVVLETIGANALNQAVKAVARARAEGYPLVIVPQQVEVLLGHGKQTVMHLTVLSVD